MPEKLPSTKQSGKLPNVFVHSHSLKTKGTPKNPGTAPDKTSNKVKR